jgi:predicted CDP-diglyceride synthetase/phosphatidate cytidylyltransferase
MGAHGQCFLYFTCSSIVEFKTKWFKGEPIWLAIWLIMVVQASDVLQYVCGKLLESTRLHLFYHHQKQLKAYWVVLF